MQWHHNKTSDEQRLLHKRWSQNVYVDLIQRRAVAQRQAVFICQMQETNEIEVWRDFSRWNISVTAWKIMQYLRQAQRRFCVISFLQDQLQSGLNTVSNFIPKPEDGKGKWFLPTK